MLTRPAGSVRWSVLLLAFGLGALTACSSAPTQPSLDRRADSARATPRTRIACPVAARPVALSGVPKLALPCLGPGPSLEVGRSDGRPTVVNLWASWCGPCAEEMPMLQEEFTRAAGRIGFVGIDTDDTPSPASALLAYAKVSYPQAEDTRARVRSALAVPGLPVTMVFDRHGGLVARHIGQIDRETLRAALRTAAR